MATWKTEDGGLSLDKRGYEYRFAVSGSRPASYPVALRELAALRDALEAILEVELVAAATKPNKAGPSETPESKVRLTPPPNPKAAQPQPVKGAGPSESK